jgi:hypothetical protein
MGIGPESVQIVRAMAAEQGRSASAIALNLTDTLAASEEAHAASKRAVTAAEQASPDTSNAVVELERKLQEQAEALSSKDYTEYSARREGRQDAVISKADVLAQAEAWASIYGVLGWMIGAGLIVLIACFSGRRRRWACSICSTAA